MNNWTEFDGSDEQIAELSDAKDGVCLMFEHSKESFVYAKKDISTVDGIVTLSNTVTHYWIIPDDPLREMKIRWAQTGQPVWWRFSDTSFEPGVRCTTSPDWNIPNAEYSFTPFEDLL